MRFRISYTSTLNTLHTFTCPSLAEAWEVFRIFGYNRKEHTLKQVTS